LPARLGKGRGSKETSRDKDGSSHDDTFSRSYLFAGEATRMFLVEGRVLTGAGAAVPLGIVAGGRTRRRRPYSIAI
jgi:hypothetical protein